MSERTQPRQVRLLKCAIRYPGIEQRASNDRDKLVLDSYGFDITNFVQRIDIYESIFDNTISGSITLLENIGLVEYLPIVGVESLVVSFSVDGADGRPKTFTRAFRISKVHNQTFARNDFRLYQVAFVTHEFVTSISTRICRRFYDTCSGAVKSVLERDLNVKKEQILITEETADRIPAVIPSYTPLQTINYFTLLSQTRNKESNFLFFETLEGFHFTSAQKLITDGLANTDMRTFTITQGQMSNRLVPTETARDSAIRVHQDQSFNLLEDIASGMLRSRMVHFDFLSRRVIHEESSRYTKTFKETTHLDKYPVYPDNLDASVSDNVRQFIVPSNYFTTNSATYKAAKEEPAEQRLREAVVLRNRQLRELRHIQTLIDLPGQPDLRAGTVINVIYPSSRELESKRTTINDPTFSLGTPYHSGKHLVTHVHHILTSQDGPSMEYRMNLRVCKDSLGAPLVGFKEK